MTAVDAEKVKQVAEEYKSSLTDLKFNSKPMINLLTMLADDHRECAQTIVQLIYDRIKQVMVDEKMPALYLLDSILKNIGDEYVNIIAKFIINTFCHVFEHAKDERKRLQLFKLRNTWTQYIPSKVLYELDKKTQIFDPNWPVAALSSNLPPQPATTALQQKIHINPKFLTKKEESSKIAVTLAASLTADSNKDVKVKTSKERLLEEERKVQEKLKQLQNDKMKREREQHEEALRKQTQERERVLAEKNRQLELLRRQQQSLSTGKKLPVKKEEVKSPQKPDIKSPHKTEIKSPPKSEVKATIHNSRDPRLKSHSYSSRDEQPSSKLYSRSNVNESSSRPYLKVSSNEVPSKQYQKTSLDEPPSRPHPSKSNINKSPSSKINVVSKIMMTCNKKKQKSIGKPSIGNRSESDSNRRIHESHRKQEQPFNSRKEPSKDELKQLKVTIKNKQDDNVSKERISKEATKNDRKSESPSKSKTTEPIATAKPKQASELTAENNSEASQKELPKAFSNLSDRDMQIAAQAAAIATAMHQMQNTSGGAPIGADESATLAAKLIQLVQSSAPPLAPTPAAATSSVDMEEPMAVDKAEKKSHKERSYRNHKSDILTEDNREKSPEKGWSREKSEPPRKGDAIRPTSYEGPPHKKTRDDDNHEKSRKARARSPSRYHFRIEKKIEGDKKVEENEREFKRQRTRKDSGGEVVSKQQRMEEEDNADDLDEIDLPEYAGSKITAGAKPERLTQEEWTELKKVRRREFRNIKIKISETEKENPATFRMHIYEDLHSEIVQKCKGGLMSNEQRETLEETLMKTRNEMERKVRTAKVMQQRWQDERPFNRAMELPPPPRHLGPPPRGDRPLFRPEWGPRPREPRPMRPERLPPPPHLPTFNRPPPQRHDFPPRMEIPRPPMEANFRPPQHHDRFSLPPPPRHDFPPPHPNFRGPPPPRPQPPRGPPPMGPHPHNQRPFRPRPPYPEPNYQFMQPPPRHPFPPEQFQPERSHSPYHDSPKKQDVVPSVDALLGQLLAAGMLSKQQPVQEEEPQQLDINAPNVDLKIEELKKRHVTVVNNLFMGEQCSSCGERFPSKDRNEYRVHLDWHFRQNRKDKDGIRKVASRAWYPDLETWVEHHDSILPIREDGKVQSSFFEEEREGELPTKTVVEEDNSIPVTAHDGDGLCLLCLEPLEQFWNEELDEWRYKSSVRENEKIYHFHCFKDHVPFELDESTPVTPSSPVSGDTSLLPTPSSQRSFLSQSSVDGVEVKKENLDDTITDDVIKREDDVIQSEAVETKPESKVEVKIEQCHDVKTELSVEAEI